MAEVVKFHSKISFHCPRHSVEPVYLHKCSQTESFLSAGSHFHMQKRNMKENAGSIWTRPQKPYKLDKGHLTNWVSYFKAAFKATTNGHCNAPTKAQ